MSATGGPTGPRVGIWCAVVPPLAGFLSAVRAVSPKVVCVMEQDAGDNVANLAARFEEALHHYAAVFEALDDAAAAREERAAVERVLDVLAWDGSERRERHERLHQWAARMAGAGFAGVPLSYAAKMEADAALRRCGLRGYETRGVEGGCLPASSCAAAGGLSAPSPRGGHGLPNSQGSASSGSGSGRQPQITAAPGQMASTWTAWPLQLPPPVDHTH